ncbi:DNA/RNA polymerases superfamily protein [Gossypium australe]|uniref:DNA/RNA polymerases superfamily protein n=1 Tax=Gossypium australe TaxID=47621 RepID=A0A5B6VWF0_9ROSI|nr:DNA/RNA polymerases superfamily protein [Gossypium australe]
MSDKLSFGVEETTIDVIVVSPLGQSVIVNNIYRRSPLEVQGVVFSVDLMELLFGEFHLILGMDWLVEHQVSLDCASERVTLRTTGGREIVMFGECRDYISNVISAIVTEKLVRKLCDAYLAYMMDGNGIPRCDSRGVIGVTSRLLGIAPLFIAPYHIAPKELQELKIQLQELLDREINRPRSSSPIFQEEKWFPEVLYQLPIVEQTGYQE